MKYLGTISDPLDLTTKQYVDNEVSGVSDSLTSHINNKSNPHSVTKSQVGLGNVEDKSSATIRSELTKDNVTDALGYTPPTQDTTYSTGTSTTAGITKLYTGTGTNTDGSMTQKAITAAIPSLSGYATESWVEGKGYLTSAPVTSVNSKTGAVTLTYSDVSAVPTSRTVNGKALSSNITLAASDVGAVPTTRTVNGKALSSNITLSASDVGAATTKTYTATLGTTWSGSAAPYTQSVTVSGILATDTPIVDFVATTSGYEAEQEDWAKVFKIVTGANSLTFYASDKTTTSLSIQVKVVK